MSLYLDEEKNEAKAAPIIWSILIVLIILVLAGIFGIPQASVYSRRLRGKAILAEATYSRDVAIAEARAKMESASLLAEAEVIRAKGVAKANKIIGESLRNNEAYLHYLWITDVCGANVAKTVVYIPTEANLPIMEATRLNPLNKVVNNTRRVKWQ